MTRTNDFCYKAEYEGLFDHQISAHPKEATDILSILSDYLILVLLKVRAFI